MDDEHTSISALNLRQKAVIFYVRKAQTIFECASLSLYTCRISVKVDTLSRRIIDDRDTRNMPQHLLDGIADLPVDLKQRLG